MAKKSGSGEVRIVKINGRRMRGAGVADNVADARKWSRSSSKRAYRKTAYRGIYQLYEAI